jgi:hypothetical protein
MPGFSFTILLLPGPNDSVQFNCEKILSLLDAPADAPGWKQTFDADSHPIDFVHAQETPEDSLESVRLPGEHWFPFHSTLCSQPS